LIIFISTIYISHREAKATNSLKPNDVRRVNETA